MLSIFSCFFFFVCVHLVFVSETYFCRRYSSWRITCHTARERWEKKNSIEISSERNSFHYYAFDQLSRRIQKNSWSLRAMRTNGTGQFPKTSPRTSKWNVTCAIIQCKTRARFGVHFVCSPAHNRFLHNSNCRGERRRWCCVWEDRKGKPSEIYFKTAHNCSPNASTVGYLAAFAASVALAIIIAPLPPTVSFTLLTYIWHFRAQRMAVVVGLSPFSLLCLRQGSISPTSTHTLWALTSER